MLAVVLAASLFFSVRGNALPVWDFETGDESPAWVPNSHLGDVRIDGGILQADGVDSDPFLSCRDLSIAATPYRYFLLRVKADYSGEGEIFWSGTFEGEYGGLSQSKSARFPIEGDGAWKEIVVFPFWQSEGTVRQLRLDLYHGAHFEIDSVRLLEWGGEKAPTAEVSSWNLGGDLDTWRIHPAAAEFFAPPLQLSIEDKNWVTVRLRSQVEGEASVLWSLANGSGLQSESFEVRGDGRFHTYNIEMAGLPTWRGSLVAFGIRLPVASSEKIYLDTISVGENPSGPPALEDDYLGFENGVNRIGRTCSILARTVNRGGAVASSATLTLSLPSGVRFAQGGPLKVLEKLEIGGHDYSSWAVVAESTGPYTLSLDVEGPGEPEPVEVTVTFEEALDLPQADYVPEPSPVKTDIDVLMYYFPGWASDANWDPVRFVAPIRKPLLGYYDEANPECVDWQIKWAVENGISCFLVDWYWVAGQQHLTHWLEAYRKSRYRDRLKIALMWANHNPPGTHSEEDWRNVTRHWIDEYFSMETYYRIDGKPAVFLWDPRLIRTDLGSSEAVRRMFDESQRMAREAGRSGVTFLAMHNHDSPKQAELLLQEGYEGATNYHEWGEAPSLASTPKRMRFSDLVETAPAAWARRDAMCGDLTYYPLVETGWDARPWHGNRARVIAGRNPDLFEKSLRDAKKFCRETGKSRIILGPANEWGEGSYIEPCTEFGFEMYERIRKVYGEGDPESWPRNIGPADVGLGTYDFEKQPLVTSWTFDDGACGWRGMMNTGDFEPAEGWLRFRTLSCDTAIAVDTPGLRADEFSGVVVRMRLVGPIPSKGVGQLFWSRKGTAMTEATSVRFPVEVDGEERSYTLDLGENSRWRGKIGALRFDPCNVRDVEVFIDEIRLVSESGP